MQRMRVVLALILIALVAGCASIPQRDKVPLVKTDRYSEEYMVNHQGLQLFVRKWEPTQQAKGNVVVLHGTTLHGGVYAGVAERLSATGYRVYALDMQGWGRSEGKGGPGFVKSFDDYASDLYLVVNTLQQRYPGAPNYVIGESLGGAVAMYSAIRRESLFAGVITSAVGYKPNPELLGIRAPGFLNSMTMTVAQWTTGIFPSLPVLDSDLGIRMVVEDEVIQAQLLKDPYVSHSPLPGAYVSTLVDAGDYIEKNMKYFDKPLLLLHGSEDMLVPLSSSEELYNAVASKQKDLHVYKSPHSVLLENASIDAVSDVINFLDSTQSGHVASVSYPQ